MVLHRRLLPEPDFSDTARETAAADNRHRLRRRAALPCHAPVFQPSDTYTGIDVSNSFIGICRTRYTDPNVTFVHLDASNALYASHHSVKRLPRRFEDEAFNFMTALSVWTHLNEGDFTFYLKELRRTLTPGGKALVSVFIMDAVYEETLCGRTDAQSAYYPQPASMWIFDQKAYGSESFLPQVGGRARGRYRRHEGGVR